MDLNASNSITAFDFVLLSDVCDNRRTVYDRTGSIEASEELGGDQFKDLYEYYRAMHAPVTEEAIDDFASSYQGSEEERSDVLSYYQKFKGDMNQVFQWVILSDPDIDSIRFMEYIDEAIKADKVSRYQPYTKWTRKVSKSKSKSKLTTTGNDRKRKNTESKRSRAEEREIEALMVKREGAFHGMLSAMASKYGVKPLSKSEEPSEEEFEAARRRIEQRKSKK